MCYYNSVKVKHEEFLRLKTIEKAIAKYDFLQRDIINGFDYGKTPVLKKIDGKTDFDIVEMEWGFLPPYVTSTEGMLKHRRGFTKPDGKFQLPFTTLNATAEEMLQPRKMYRDAALMRRCLVVSTGFYEWQHVFPTGKNGKPLKTPVKYPHHIGVKDSEYFFMAGIWSPVTYRDTGEIVETVANVTTVANSKMAKIHNRKKRMPTILTEDLAWEWLFADLSEERIAEIAAFQFPAEKMESCSIDKGFLSSLNPTEPHTYPELVSSDAEEAGTNLLDGHQADLFG